MRTKITRIILIIITVLILCSISQAVTVNAAYDVKSFSGEAGKGVNEMRTILNVVLTVIRVAGTGIALIMLTVIGAKYMMASAGEKAEIKKHATVYVIGAIVMIAATGILGIIRDFVSTSTSTN